MHEEEKVYIYVSSAIIEHATYACHLSFRNVRHYYPECTLLWCAYCIPRTVRLLTHVLCKPTHFFFHSFIVTVHN